MSAVDTGLRGWRERLAQTLAFEAGGLALVAPPLSRLAGQSTGESLALLAALSIAVMAWSALFNTAFDRAERRLCGRVASRRPPAWRLLHAVAHEAGAALASCPLIVAMSGLGWAAALVADLGLSLVYAAYACAFHRAWDRLRPVAVPRLQAPAADAAATPHCGQ